MLSEIGSTPWPKDPVPRSLRTRLLVILGLLAAAAVASGVIMFGLFEQSTSAQIGQAAAVAGRGCDAITRAYRFYTADWQAGPATLADAGLRQDLTSVAFTALRNKPGIEGGIWQAEAGAVAYAYPTYEGSGPKTDVPAAELPRIAAINERALKDDRPQLSRVDAGAQTLLLTACPLPGPISHLTAWTMTRVHSLSGDTYWRLMTGLAILVAAVAGASILAASLVMTWSRHVARMVDALSGQAGDLPPLPSTGERELDLIVEALNGAGTRLKASRAETERLARQVAISERMAAVGRVTAGVAHEIRNPIAAMRLKAEIALKGRVERKHQALEFTIGQVDRLDLLIGRLLTASERDPVHCETVAMEPFLDTCAGPHREAAASREITLHIITTVETGWFDPVPMGRAMSNLVLNALQNSPPGRVTVSAAREGERLVLAVTDPGSGPPDAIRARLFDPFVSGRPDGAGLGLAIVREIATAHGGSAEFCGPAGATTFRIVLPCPAS